MRRKYFSALIIKELYTHTHMHLHIDMEKNQSKRKMGTAYEQALY